MEEKVLQLGERRAITLKIWLKDMQHLHRRIANGI